MLSLVSVVESLDAAASTIRVGRATEEGRQIVEAKLPAVVSVGKDIAAAARPILHGHPQSFSRHHPHLVARRPGHPCADLCGALA